MIKTRMFQRSSLLLILSRNSLALLSVGLLIPLLAPLPLLGVELWRVWWSRAALLVCAIIAIHSGGYRLALGGERGLNRSRILAVLSRHWLLAAIIVWFLWNGVVSLFGGSWELALFGNPHRADGLLTLSVMLVGCILVTFRSGKRGIKHFAILATRYSTLVSLLMLLMVVTAALISAGLQGALPLYQYTRSGLGNINLTAGALLAAMPWLLVRLWRYRVWASVTGWLGITLLLSILGSLTGSVVSGVIGGVLLAVLTARKLSIFLVLAGAVVSAFLFYQQIMTQVALQYTSTEGRAQIYQSLISASLEKPLFGWGWAGVSSAYRAQVSQQSGTIAGIALDKAHSSWLEQLVTAGIPGLLLLLIVQGGVILSTVRAYQSAEGVEREWWLAASAAISVHLVFSQANVTSVHQEVLFWLMACLVLWKNSNRAHAA